MQPKSASSKRETKNRLNAKLEQIREANNISGIEVSAISENPDSEYGFDDKIDAKVDRGMYFF